MATEPSPVAAGRQRATIRDVARLAGVHPSTVSRVLNGDARRAVAETRQRIAEAARSLDWRPNAAARSLSTGLSYTLGMQIPSFGNTAYAKMIAGAQVAAESSGNVLLVTETSGDEERIQLQSERMADRVDGIVIASDLMPSTTMAMLEERGVPLVQLNRRAAGATQSVIADDEAGVTLALRHLHELGHRRIGYIVGKARYDTTERRVRAYRTFSKEQGLANSGLIYRGSLVPARLRMGIAKLLDRPVHERPTALLAINLQAAVQLLTALRELGLRVPEDLSVMGFDDGPLAEHLWPPLTTIWMPREAMGKKAVEVLLSLLGRHDVPDTIMVEAAPEFIERASTAPVMPSSNH